MSDNIHSHSSESDDDANKSLNLKKRSSSCSSSSTEEFDLSAALKHFPLHFSPKNTNSWIAFMENRFA